MMVKSLKTLRGGGGREGAGETATRNDVHGTFFQGSDATVADVFAPLGPPLLPWENHM